ncbi:MAG: hypothetical protein ACR2LQ_02745 [Acidimicrobiales bacterium]
MRGLGSGAGRVRRASRMIGAGAVLAVVSLGGCATRDADAARATEAVVGFYEAFAAGDGAAACQALSEQAVHEVEKSSSKSCAEGIVDEQLDDPGQHVDTEVFGDEALATFESDTAFVTHVGSTWLVAAAGCEPKAGEPYDCTIQGG